jgi:hypothetical protein
MRAVMDSDQVDALIPKVADQFDVPGMDDPTTAKPVIAASRACGPRGRTNPAAQRPERWQEGVTQFEKLKIAKAACRRALHERPARRSDDVVLEVRVRPRTDGCEGGLMPAVDLVGVGSDSVTDRARCSLSNPSIAISRRDRPSWGLRAAARRHCCGPLPDDEAFRGRGPVDGRSVWVDGRSNGAASTTSPSCSVEANLAAVDDDRR